MEPLACSNQSYSGLGPADEPVPHLITDPVHSSGERVPVFKNPTYEELDHVTQLDRNSKIAASEKANGRTRYSDCIEGVARGNVSHNGNVFIWPENDAEHSEIGNATDEGVAVGFSLRPGEKPRISGYSSHPYQSRIVENYEDPNTAAEVRSLKKQLEQDYNEELAPHGISVKIDEHHPIPNDREVWEKILYTNPHIKKLI